MGAGARGDPRGPSVAWWGLALAGLFVLGDPGVARADPSPRAVAAEELFLAGRDLLAARHFKEACDKLDQSERLDPAVGTLFSLGECYAAQGRTASAWFAYRTAMALASGRDDRRRKAAEERAAAIEPQLATLAVQAPAGARVTVDGEAFTPDALRNPLPVDPGPHTITVGETGYFGWTKRIEVRGAGESAVVAVPPLVPLPNALATARAHDRGERRRVLGIGVGAAGIAAIGVGAVLGMQAVVKGRDANRACPGSTACGDAQAVHENDVAKAYAAASTVTIPVGTVLALAGSYLLLTGRSAPLEAGVRVSSGGGRVELGWSW